RARPPYSHFAARPCSLRTPRSLHDALPISADIWGRFSVSPVLGVIFLVHQTGAAIGSSLAGALFEATGGYGAAFAVACVFLATASVVALRIDTGGRRVGGAAPEPALD